MTDPEASESLHAFQHPLRQPMLDEIYARPFLKLQAPAHLAYIALKPIEDGLHTPELSHQQLCAFLDRFDAPHPDDGAVYYFVRLGNMTLKWENHSEFASYTLFSGENAGRQNGTPYFQADLHHHFTSDWIEAFPGRIVAAVQAEVDRCSNAKEMQSYVKQQGPSWFATPAGFAASYVTDQSAAIFSDFLQDPSGHVRVVLLANDAIGPSRIGRAMQRFLEVETYRAMSMLTLPIARSILGELRGVDAKLVRTVDAMGDKGEQPGQSLEELILISSELALISSKSSFRFSAARAYENLVSIRLDLLREERFAGRQLLSELILRGYNPAMRTCRSAHQQVIDMSERASKAADLLGTRVSVTTAEQNRKLLAKMDTRAAQQARLQETVEGISVVAISYYAVSLLTYLLAPLTKLVPISKTVLAASLVLPVAIGVWFAMRRLKERLIRKPDQED